MPLSAARPTVGGIASSRPVDRHEIHCRSRVGFATAKVRQVDRQQSDEESHFGLCMSHVVAERRRRVEQVRNCRQRHWQAETLLGPHRTAHLFRPPPAAPHVPRASLRLPSHHPLTAQTAATNAPSNATAEVPSAPPSKAVLTCAVIASEAR